MKAIRWIMMMRAGGFIMSAEDGSIARKSNCLLVNKFMNVQSVGSISKPKTFGWRGRKGQCKPSWLEVQDEKP